MGKYVWYSGAADYPLEKRKRIKENILKMLDAGGMMQIESVKNNNHELYVLSKPEKDQNNRILWNYNYFEDDMWETEMCIRDRYFAWEVMNLLCQEIFAE